MIQCWGNYTAVGLLSSSVSMHFTLELNAMERMHVGALQARGWEVDNVFHGMFQVSFNVKKNK